LEKFEGDEVLLRI